LKVLLGLSAATEKTLRLHESGGDFKARTLVLEQFHTAPALSHDSTLRTNMEVQMLKQTAV
jgi:hypothetical protein